MEPDVRPDAEVVDQLVTTVKDAIANGTYETPERIEVAIDGLLRDLREMGRQT